MFNFNGFDLIQGGMGIGVSTWLLAREVSVDKRNRSIGTVSGTAADVLLARVLQAGDFGGNYRRALSHFPFKEIADRVIKKYFVECGIKSNEGFKQVPMFSLNPSDELIELTICANFALVWLAKEGHSNPVFINYLEKVQMPHIYSIFGAMLAGVDGIVMGAGRPNQIPAVIDAVLSGDELVYRIDVKGQKDGFLMKFDPKKSFGNNIPKMERPAFFPIVSSYSLANYFAKKLRGKVDGLIVELPTAGGHNAPPRGEELNESGEPVYGEKDRVPWENIRDLGLPFWIGGSFASPKKLKEAKELGAVGVQVGTLFAFCEESGIKKGIKRGVVDNIFLKNRFSVKTSMRASPTGFPFKVLDADNTHSDSQVSEARDCKRVCNKGYLRQAVLVDGKIVLRCSAEPVESYQNKGGEKEDTAGRICLCNALLSLVGNAHSIKHPFPDVADSCIVIDPLGDDNEPPIITSGDNASAICQIIKRGRVSYNASEVIDYILG